MVVVVTNGVVKDIPDPRVVPPLIVSYQLIVPAEAVADKTPVPSLQINVSVVVKIVGVV